MRPRSSIPPASAGKNRVSILANLAMFIAGRALLLAGCTAHAPPLNAAVAIQLRLTKLLHSLLTFVLHWCLLSILLWLASKVFHGIEFKSSGALWVSALLLGFANAVIRPVFIVFTFPLTLLTFGFFLLVINALMLLLVAALVPGFKVSGFWTAFFAGLLISALSLVIDIATSTGVSTVVPAHHGSGTMV